LAVPPAVLKPVRRPFLGWFWILPGVVLAIASLVIILSLSHRGPRIFIHFNEGYGLKSGDAVRCRGITVGEVRSVELSPDLKGVDVVIDLRPTASGIAVEGSRFWIVRPQAALTGLSGLDTVVGAKYVAVSPGGGKPRREFVGAEEAPVDTAPGGLKIVLKGERMGGLRAGVPLIYRQVRIGSVVSARLARDAGGVDVEVQVLPAYKELVRENSEFWNVSGFRLQGSVVSGLTLAAESAETLLAGGVAMVTFATPGPPVKQGHRFRLADEPPKEHGERLLVHFKDGHGLKPGDLLRHRGITLGEVHSVKLSHDKTGVDLEIDLRPMVDGIAVEDSRFWIVRPQADLTGLSGLDTLVGARYVAVSPGSGKPRREFDGADEAPVLVEPGRLEIVLQSKRMGGLRPGVPLTYRQVRIGSVVSARLASDASAVEAHVHVQPAYRELVRKNSYFWNVSGLKLGFGWRSGLTFDAESAQTVLAGGVAMATPNEPGERVQDGKRFDLADEPPPDFLTKWNPSIPLIEPRLPPGVTVPRLVRATLEYTSKGRVYNSRKKERGLVLPVARTWLLGPTDLLRVPPKTVGGQGALAFEGVGQMISADSTTRTPPPLRWFKITDPALREALKETLPRDRLRHPEKREDCLLVADSSLEPLFVSVASLKQNDQGWTIDASLSGDLTREKWHGAAAVRVRDGAVIGLLQVPEKGPKLLIPLPKDLLRR
jgi:paraquat-inducible protein B